MVAVFEGYAPAQTRPYSYGNNHLMIIRHIKVTQFHTFVPCSGTIFPLCY